MSRASPLIEDRAAACGILNDTRFVWRWLQDWYCSDEWLAWRILDQRYHGPARVLRNGDRNPGRREENKWVGKREEGE